MIANGIEPGPHIIPAASCWSVRAEMPLSEITDLIVDLRSLTQGVGTFEMEFDHFAELAGKLADQVVATERAA